MISRGYRPVIRLLWVTPLRFTVFANNKERTTVFLSGDKNPPLPTDRAHFIYNGIVHIAHSYGAFGSGKPLRIGTNDETFTTYRYRNTLRLPVDCCLADPPSPLPQLLLSQL